MITRLREWWSHRYDWLTKRLDMEGPKEVGCITITVYETTPVTLTFQFAGLNGQPMNPYLIHHVLLLVAQAVEKSVQPPSDSQPQEAALTTHPQGVLV